MRFNMENSFLDSTGVECTIVNGEMNAERLAQIQAIKNEKYPEHWQAFEIEEVKQTKYETLLFSWKK